MIEWEKKYDFGSKIREKTGSYRKRKGIMR